MNNLQEILQKFYLEYANNFITTYYMAEYYGLSQETVSQMIKEGKLIHEKKIRNIENRLEYLRQELRAEKISYNELAELKSLSFYIDKSDVELLEAAGVPE